jgi:hypothetical protein
MANTSMFPAIMAAMGHRPCRMQWVELHGMRLIFGSHDDGQSGFLATQHQYENFETSYAHLGEDGIVRRFNEQIATRDDITFTGEAYDL